MEKKKLTLRIAFDVVNEDNEIVSSKDYPNASEISLIVDSISKKECYLLTHFINERVLMLVGNEHLGHLFPKPFSINSEDNQRIEYSLSRIELLDSDTDEK